MSLWRDIFRSEYSVWSDRSNVKVQCPHLRHSHIWRFLSWFPVMWSQLAVALTAAWYRRCHQVAVILFHRLTLFLITAVRVMEETVRVAVLIQGRAEAAIFKSEQPMTESGGYSRGDCDDDDDDVSSWRGITENTRAGWFVLDGAACSAVSALTAALWEETQRAESRGRFRAPPTQGVMWTCFQSGQTTGFPMLFFLCGCPKNTNLLFWSCVTFYPS